MFFEPTLPESVYEIYLVKTVHLFQATWVWKNGMVVRTKVLNNILIKKVKKLNSKIKRIDSNSIFLKDMMELNMEIVEHLGSLTDTVNVRDLFDFLTMCFCEYDHLYRENKEDILLHAEERSLLPLAHEIMFTHIQNILDFITNNTVNS